MYHSFQKILSRNYFNIDNELFPNQHIRMILKDRGDTEGWSKTAEHLA